MMVCPLKFQTLKIISVRCIMQSLRLMARRSNTSASNLDLRLSIGRYGQLRTSLRQTWRVQFSHHKLSLYITNFHFPFLKQDNPLSSNIPSSLGCEFLYHSSYDTQGLAPLMNVLFRVMWLSNKLLEQRYDRDRFEASLREFYDQYGGLIKWYEVPLSLFYMTFWNMTISSAILNLS